MDVEMEYTHLGSTGLEVSRLCLGCANFGSGKRPDGRWNWTIDDEEQSLEIIDRAIDLGINFLDTANQYSTGESEEIVGNAIEGRRDELVVASKVGAPMADHPNGGGLSRKHVLEQAQASLERLGTDYLDLYQLHRPDSETPLSETLAALTSLVESGSIRYVGASNFVDRDLVKALYTGRLDGSERLASVQSEYNLVTRHEELNSIPVCEDHSIGLITYSPLAAGFLADVAEPEQQPDHGRLAQHTALWNRLDTEQCWEVLDVVKDIAEQKGATPVQISVAWLLAREPVDSVIIGPNTIEQLEEYVGALAVSLTDDERARLEAPLTPTWTADLAF